jgi:hypothetical protein
MKITNDHYNHFPDSAWTRDERNVYITDDSGCVWEIKTNPSGGVQVRPIVGGNQVVVLPVAGNTIVVRAEP